ncbi:protein of unknown function [Azospirillum baldaniorum]|uniref:Uncharacterized protein n=1 Tax=Azospirillum baldaniorum TaxID=1064539 RepID=A0A9P1JMK2_9PROT|nr:protein of unknown function [Azospirillum baldaniorum]
MSGFHGRLRQMLPPDYHNGAPPRSAPAASVAQFIVTRFFVHYSIYGATIMRALDTASHRLASAQGDGETALPLGKGRSVRFRHTETGIS